MNSAAVDVPVALAGCIERLKRDQEQMLTGSTEWQRQRELITWLEDKNGE